jgi:hypothetical protein
MHSGPSRPQAPAFRLESTIPCEFIVGKCAKSQRRHFLLLIRNSSKQTDRHTDGTHAKRRRAPQSNGTEIMISKDQRGTE